MKYTFACPIAGCDYTSAVDADDNNEAVIKLTDRVKEHLRTVHPDVHKSDAEVKADIAANLNAM